MLPDYNNKTNLIYDNLKKLGSDTYNYRIYFYNGEEADSVGNAKTTEGSFPFKMANGIEAEREEYALKIKKIINEVFNNADFGVQFVYDGWEDFDSAVFIKNKGEGSITIFLHQKAMAISYPESWGVKLSLISDEKGLKGTIVHELQHCLGLMHTKGRTGSSKYSEDGTIKYGNPYFQYMPFSMGNDKLCPESLNSLDVLYENNTILQINGNIDISYWDGYKDGYAEAFIIKIVNGHGELINHTIVDSSGYFEFRLRTIPNFKAKYKLLVVSSGINYNFVESVKHESKGLIGENYPEEDLLYGIHPIKELSKPIVSGQKINIENVKMNKKTATLKKLGKNSNVIMVRKK